MRKVLRRDWGRMKMIPVIRPGRVTEEKARVVEMKRLLEVEHSRETLPEAQRTPGIDSLT